MVPPPYSSVMFNTAVRSNSRGISDHSLFTTNASGLDPFQNNKTEFCAPRAIRGSCTGGTSINNFLVEQSSQSISDTIVSCNDLSEMMNALSISQPGGIRSFPTQQELYNLRALYELSQSSSYTVDNWDWSMPSNSNEAFDNQFHHIEGADFLGATRTWSGVLPPRFVFGNTTFSCKLFLGGVPWDMTEDSLVRAFSQFGKVRVEWPGKEQAVHQPKGHVYIILESEKRVRALLNSCTCTVSSGNCRNWFFRIQSKKIKSKDVQVIPWTLEDSNYAQSPSQKVDPQSTVFVGALHGMINAEGLFNIMNDLFGGVVYAGIDTDKFKYPIGSARVTFSNRMSFLNAVSAAFIQVKTPKFTKKLQIDPYLDDSTCSSCEARQGIYFCRDVMCFRYFCSNCWVLYHNACNFHKPLMRRKKCSAV